MKTTLIISVIFVVAAARPQNSRQNPRDAYITRYEQSNDGSGRFSFSIRTSDGFQHDQSGQLRNTGSENESLAVEGSYSYIGPDGVTYAVIYTADEDGFQPAGAHLPPSAGVKKLGIPPSAQASLLGGGIG